MIFIEIEDVYKERWLINVENIVSIRATVAEGGAPECVVQFGHSDKYVIVSKSLPEIKGMLIYAVQEVLAHG